MTAICRVHELVLVTTDGRQKAFRYGQASDLDAMFGKQTLREALGDYVTAFDPVLPPAPPMAPAEGESK